MTAKREDTAFMAAAFPVNAIPFLRRMLEILEENETNNPLGLNEKESIKYEANLFVINSQFYGQLFSINAMDIFSDLENKMNRR